jgi:hypothetical protein
MKLLFGMALLKENAIARAEDRKKKFTAKVNAIVHKKRYLSKKIQDLAFHIKMDSNSKLMDFDSGSERLTRKIDTARIKHDMLLKKYDQTLAKEQTLKKQKLVVDKKTIKDLGKNWAKLADHFQLRVEIPSHTKWTLAKENSLATNKDAFNNVELEGQKNTDLLELGNIPKETVNTKGPMRRYRRQRKVRRLISKCNHETASIIEQNHSIKRINWLENVESVNRVCENDMHTENESNIQVLKSQGNKHYRRQRSRKKYWQQK